MFRSLDVLMKQQKQAGRILACSAAIDVGALGDYIADLAYTTQNFAFSSDCIKNQADCNSKRGQRLAGKHVRV